MWALKNYDLEDLLQIIGSRWSSDETKLVMSLSLVKLGDRHMRVHYIVLYTSV